MSHFMRCSIDVHKIGIVRVEVRFSCEKCVHSRDMRVCHYTRQHYLLHRRVQLLYESVFVRELFVCFGAKLHCLVVRIRSERAFVLHDNNVVHKGVELVYHYGYRLVQLFSRHVFAVYAEPFVKSVRAVAYAEIEDEHRIHKEQYRQHSRNAANEITVAPLRRSHSVHDNADEDYGA